MKKLSKLIKHQFLAYCNDCKKWFIDDMHENAWLDCPECEGFLTRKIHDREEIKSDR